MTETAVDDKMLSRVRALLAKAESTTFPEEAEALLAKAQELMTRYAIDAAMASADPSRRARARAGERPILRPFDIAEPYRSAKTSMLGAVADANDVRVVITRDGPTLVGFESDIRATEMLFTSLLVQMAREMAVAASRLTDGRLRAFRHAFIVSFGARIGSRLREARSAATAAATTTIGMALVPVMAARADAVEQAINDNFGALRSRRATLSHRGGWVSGAVAADRADIGSGRRLAGSQGAIDS